MSFATNNPRLPLGLFILCLGVYGIGVYLTRAFLCQPIGAWVLLAGVAVGGLSAVLLLVSSAKQRSLGLGVGAISIALVAAFLYFFVGVLTLPGCSGV